MVTICACASRSFICKETVDEIAAALTADGHTVSIVPDLCHIAQDSPSELKAIAEGMIVACHERTIRSIMHWRGLEAPQVRNIREASAEGRSLNGTDAWYPVIDKDRCIECGKCNDFCLFGVYTVEDKHVRVTQPQNCKNNCPACARMCPQQAIIFPKYDKSPINGGTELEETFSPEETSKMYAERLKYRLQQRREGGNSLFKKE
jgi:NAD-dependent dihydropyrimidine dehydrogenase PreA subunit